MDLSKITSSLLSSDTLKGLSNLTGANTKDISNVLTSALPSLLKGVTEQAKNNVTAEGFAKALAQHAKDDTSSLSGFLGKVDLADGAKIISHLLGSDKEETINRAVMASGVSANNVNAILSAIAPMLLSLLGKQTEEDGNQESGVRGLVGNLLDNVDMGSLLSGLTGASSDKDDKKNDAGGIIGGILSGLLKK